MKRPKIQEYTRMQDFFKDWFQFLKHLDPKWSIRKFAKESQIALGLASSLQTKKTNLTQTSLNKILPRLKLLPSEESYLRTWIPLLQNTNTSAQLNAVKNLEKFKEFKNRHPKEFETFKYLSHWYHLAIREMSDLPDFKADPKWIQDRLLWKTPLKDIERALSFLKKNNFIETDSNSAIAKPEKTIDCKSDFLSLALTHMHQNFLTRAQSALLTVPSDKRHFEGYTVALNQDDYSKAVGIIQSALDQISNLVQSSTHTKEVFHLEVALFPLTQTEKILENNSNKKSTEQK